MRDSASEKSSAKSNGKWISKGTAVLPEHVIESVRKVYENAIEVGTARLKEMNGNAADVARRYPVQTAVSALAIGFLFGAVIGRRR